MPHAPSDQTEYAHLTLPATPEHLQSLRREVMRFLASLPMSQDRRGGTSASGRRGGRELRRARLWPG
jgi:hypothetical protein